MATQQNIGHYILGILRYFNKILVGNTIGEGTFGKVKMGTHILTDEKVAVKILEKDKIKEYADLERIAREINILKLQRHTNIIQLYEIVETPYALYLIMEYAEGGELFDYIVKNTRLKEKDAAKFLLQIISGIAYLHQLKICHRDLKPENLLLDYANNIKIVDFGLSNVYGSDEKLQTACGSPCYAAPEMIAGKVYNGVDVDIWSCGVILYAMLCGYLPFEDPITNNLYKKIMSGDYQIPKFITPLAKQMISGILNIDPQKRFKIKDIIEHDWMTSCLNQSHLKLEGGFMVETQNMTMDESVLEQLLQFNFNIDYAKACLQSNKHNYVTTSYYLILQKKKKQEAQLLLEQNEIRLKEIISNHNSRRQQTEENHVKKTRAVSVSTEKNAETLFPTAQQIIDKVHKFKNNAFNLKTQNESHSSYRGSYHVRYHNKTNSFHLNPKYNGSNNKQIDISKTQNVSYETSRSPKTNNKSPMQYSSKGQSPTSRKISSNSPISTQKMKIYRGPINLNQITTKMGTQLINELLKYVNENDFKILNIKKFELVVKKENIEMDISIQLLKNSLNVLVIKCNKINGDQEVFERLQEEIINYIRE